MALTESGCRLPLLLEDGVKDAAGSAASDGSRFLLEAPDDVSARGPLGTTSGQPATISISEMKALIVKLDQWREAGEGVDGYLECVRDSFVQDRYLNGYKERGESMKTTYDFYLDSGLPARTVMREPLPMAGKWWIEGEDRALFAVESGSLHTTRPLPTGEHRFFSSYQMPESIPCNYHPDELRTKHENSVHVTAPTNTLHEAFFDPVDMDSATGAGGADGGLKPTSFTDESGAVTTIQRIEWESGMVELQLAGSGSGTDPQTDLADHHVDFIALDGTVALRLDFDDAVEATDAGELTLTWGVCEQPWSAGDLLMLRISQSSPDLTGATNDTACPSASP